MFVVLLIGWLVSFISPCPNLQCVSSHLLNWLTHVLMCRKYNGVLDEILMGSKKLDYAVVSFVEHHILQCLLMWPDGQIQSRIDSCLAVASQETSLRHLWTPGRGDRVQG